MSTLKRIVFIVPDCGEGGLFQFYNQLIPELAHRAEVHVIFASPYHSPQAPSIAGVKCHFLPAEGAITASNQLAKGPLAIAPDIVRSLAVAHRAWKAALLLEPDCVEMCDWPLSFVPAVLDQSVPYIIQCHGSMGQIAEHDPQPGQGLAPSILHLIEPQLISAAHCVQTYSESNAGFWANMARRPVPVIRPAFALPTLPRGSQEIADSAAVLGRLQRWKGPDILCDALRLLGSRAPDVDWYGGVKPWGGIGLTADRFLAEGYPDIWAHKFHHHAAVPRHAVVGIQARALFNIVPSTWDVFNFTAVEAMAAGRPTIVSTGAGASELIADGVNGFTFANQDPADLAAAIDRVLSLSDQQRRDIGMAGRETVRTELDPARIAEQRLVAYEEAIHSFKGSPPRKPGHWITNLLASPPPHLIDPSELLAAFPMRILGKHLGNRLARKIGYAKGSK